MNKRSYIKKSSESHARLSRIAAKAVDSFICLVLAFFFYPLGVLLACIYLSICDSFPRGQSLGKRLIGFSVISLEDGAPCNLKQSFIRNLPLSLPFFLTIIPVWGWIASFIIGGGFILFELYILLKIQSGNRLGDVMADTTVVAPTNELRVGQKSQASWFESSSQISMQ